MTDRRSFLLLCAASGLSTVVGEAVWNDVEAMRLEEAPGGRQQGRRRITRDTVKAAEEVAGVRFSDAERDLMLVIIEAHLDAYEAMRRVDVPNWVRPPLTFSPLLPGQTVPRGPNGPARIPEFATPVRRPETEVELAYLTVLELGHLLRQRVITSTELTRLYLDRLTRYNQTLNCVVTLTPERAFRQAAEADREIAAGRYLGPLHGIPYGVKDILAVPGYPTTWGAEVFKDRELPMTATVIERLDSAGAVLVAKLAMGELGLSDSWFRGQTKNPWRPNQGSQGSSSGSAVSVAAGLVGFAIGAETMGSIVTPATRNGVTGLRPTFGLVSRYGAMTSCWSLDKIGPMARSVEDCALVLSAIAGTDGKDPSVLADRFVWDFSRPLSAIRVGYFRAGFEAETSTSSFDNAGLARLQRLGIQLREVTLPQNVPVLALLIIRVEAAAAFDYMTRSGQLDYLTDQTVDGFPNFFRAGRLVPAVEYLQANRIRQIFMEEMNEVFKEVDVFMAPSFGVNPATNLTGHPCLVMPNGLDTDGIPVSICLIGRLFGESDLCTVGRAWQRAAGSRPLHPPGYDL